MFIESWKPIKNFEGIYEVSNKGRVRSLDRTDSQGRNLKGKIRKSFLNKQIGYYQIGLQKDGEQKMFRIHRLVTETFIPNPENKVQVNHIDGDKLNNSVENLEWLTPLENVNHAIDSGLKKCLKGEKGMFSKLKENQVIEIFRRSNAGEVQRKLSEEYGVNQRQISNIKNGKSWSWLTKSI